MKLYITPGLATISDVTSYLNSIGVETTTDESSSNVDSFVLMRTIDQSVTVTDSDLVDYVITHNLNTASYLSSKFGIPGSHKLNDKWELQKALTELNMPKLDTVYPKTQQELEAFFASNSKVFCKPLFFYGGIDPTVQVHNLIKYSGSAEVLQSTIDSIPVPSTTKHYYNYYTSYAEFAADVNVEEFLNIQNSDAALPVHQCILQKDFTVTNPTWNHFIVLGYVNGTNDIMYEPYIVMPRGNDDAGDQSEQTRMPTKVSFDFDSFSAQDITNMLTNRHVQGSDSYDMEQRLKTLFAHTNTRNTYFTAQGYINENNEPVFFDFSTGKMSPALRRTWITNEQQLNRLKFMLDQPYDSTKLHSDVYRFWFDIRLATGISKEKLQQAANYKVKFMLPMREGFTRITCTAYGDTPQEVAQNVKAYIALCKQ